MFLWTWSSIQCSQGSTWQEFSSIFSPLQYSLKEIHLHWNVPTGNTFLCKVLFRTLLSTLSGHPQCYFWKHCDTILKTMSKNKLLLSCHLLFTKVLAFFQRSLPWYLDPLGLVVYRFSFNELFIHALVQKTWFSIYNTLHFSFYVFQWKTEKVIWISQGLPKLSCEEYQLLLSRAFLAFPDVRNFSRETISLKTHILLQFWKIFSYYSFKHCFSAISSILFWDFD